RGRDRILGPSIHRPVLQSGVICDDHGPCILYRPTVIAESLSPTTSMVDPREKDRLYLRMPTLLSYSSCTRMRSAWISTGGTGRTRSGVLLRASMGRVRSRASTWC